MSKVPTGLRMERFVTLLQSLVHKWLSKESQGWEAC